MLVNAKFANGDWSGRSWCKLLRCRNALKQKLYDVFVLA